MHSTRFFLMIASISGFLCVALGAFGAHGLKKILSPDMMVIFETAVKYQMYHALALILVSLLALHWPEVSQLKIASWFLVFGQIIFSGSLYLLVFTGIRKWGAVTPIGGLALLSGWFFLLLGILRAKF